jgi:hypothetical protein
MLKDLKCTEYNCFHVSKNETEYKAHEAWHRLQKEQRENTEREGTD